MENQGSWCGRTSQEHSPVTKEKTSDAYSQKLSGLQKTEFLFLDLRAGNGNQQEASWGMVTAWHGASWIPNTGECPSAGKESTLSQILQEDAPERYYLSEKACLGILRRAEKRGKKLPEVLRRALIQQSRGGGTTRAIMLESHPQDCRVGLAKDNIAQTLTEAMGTGGGNVPLVMVTPKTMKIRCGCEGGGKGALIQENKSATLSCNNDQTVFVPKAYGICSMESNAMKSGNPDSGFYEAETSRTIDCRGGNPGCNQGGMVILDKSPAYAIQGNMIGRAEKNGPNGKGVNKDVSFTLTALDRHGVAYAIGRDNVTAWEEKAQTLTAEELPGSVAHMVFPDRSGTLTAKMSKGSGGPAGDECYNLVAVNYIVRRLTPLECCRLQGFPDDWMDGVSDEDPDKKAVQFWMDAWAEWWALVGRAKGIKRPKDEKAVRRWLKSPASDTELYRMWGNGIALPCAQYVLEGIAAILSVTESDTRKG